jgi:RimJ/RimL family protein N-acetyltransferase
MGQVGTKKGRSSVALNYWQGERIKLRAIESRDLALFESFDDEVDRSVDAIHFPQSPERRKLWIEKEVERAQQPKDDAFRWIAENMEGQAVGTVDTFSCDRRNGTFKYGIAVAESHWGKGYAKEMVTMVLRYYFFELGYQKATPHVYSFNERSIKLHESLGFKKEGQLRRMIYSNGMYYDEIYFGMTRDEYHLPG